jgi:selenocysteine-specific elongation factor
MAPRRIRTRLGPSRKLRRIVGRDYWVGRAYRPWKTALVRALTGVNGDRLKEEKARVITIDLGFAFMTGAAKSPLGFIDVPGRERFLHTMLGGAAGIDYAILTVAANDGAKPQTLEHLAILDLLGVDRGVVVRTKADPASDERLGEVARDVRAMISETTLANACVLAVSAATGQGVSALRAHLETASSLASNRSHGRCFRLAADRVFTPLGVGVVVTGTVYSGSVRVSDRVQISPSGLTARVRSLQASPQQGCASSLVTKDSVRSLERPALGSNRSGIPESARF